MRRYVFEVLSAEVLHCGEEDGVGEVERVIGDGDF